jgi:hypothetical protein
MAINLYTVEFVGHSVQNHEENQEQYNGIGILMGELHSCTRASIWA